MSPHRSNVLLHPLHQSALVQEPDVQVAGFSYTLACKKAQSPDAIVEVDKDNVLTRLFDHLCAVPIGIGERDVS